MLRACLAIAVLLLASAGAAAQVFSADCILRPSTTVRLGAPVSGIIAAIAVDRGERVARGQEIARLDTALQEMAIRSARARIDNNAEVVAAEARVAALIAKRDRNRTLVERNVLSAAQLEESELELAMAENELLIARQNRLIAEVDLEQAEAELDRRIVRSPIDGYVIERTLSVGEFWSEERPIATLANIELLHVEAIVGIDNYAAIGRSDVAMVEPEAPIGGHYPATVAVIDPVFDAASGTFGIRLDLPNPDLAVPAGLRCTVTFGG